MRTTRLRTCIGNGRRQHMSKLHDNQLQGAHGVCALRALVYAGFVLITVYVIYSLTWGVQQVHLWNQMDLIGDPFLMAQ